MKENIKSNEPQGRTKYVPANMAVIDVTAQKVLCGSNERLEDGGDIFEIY